MFDLCPVLSKLTAEAPSWVFDSNMVFWIVCSWTIRLFLIPSHVTLWVAISTVAMCSILGIVVVALHFKEKVGADLSVAETPIRLVWYLFNKRTLLWDADPSPIPGFNLSRDIRIWNFVSHSVQNVLSRIQLLPEGLRDHTNDCIWLENLHRT